MERRERHSGQIRPLVPEGRGSLHSRQRLTASLRSSKREEQPITPGCPYIAAPSETARGTKRREANAETATIDCVLALRESIHQVFSFTQVSRPKFHHPPRWIAVSESVPNISVPSESLAGMEGSAIDVDC